VPALRTRGVAHRPCARSARTRRWRLDVGRWRSEQQGRW